MRTIKEIKRELERQVEMGWRTILQFDPNQVPWPEIRL